jgi:hypothetical protein
MTVGSAAIDLENAKSVDSLDKLVQSVVHLIVERGEKEFAG